MNIVKKTAVCLLAFGLLSPQGLSPIAVAFAQENNYASTDTVATNSQEQESTDDGVEEEESPTDSEPSAEDNADVLPSDDAHTMDEKVSAEITSVQESDEEGVNEEAGERDEVDGVVVPLSEEGVDDGGTSATTTSQEDTREENGDEQATTTEVVELIQSTDSTASSSTDALHAASSTASTTTTIVSGTSIALANVLNLVNSNFVNSEGVVLFSNFFESVFGAIDFREYFANAAAFGCSLLSCESELVAVNVNNNASIDNEILVTANSGENTIEHAGNGVIHTGDAYAGLNLVNVANTNLVDSNYLLVTLNAFQDMNGDIVFPSLSQFFGSLAGGATAPSAIAVSNTANVNNAVNVDANAGDNSVTETGSSEITTGNAIGSSNVFNQLNSSLIGGQSVSVVFRVHGSWAGEIFGAPDNLAWTAGDDGSIYLFDVGNASQNGSLTMHGTSTARINNNVNVIALTGANAITNAETAVISTGNAYAGANIINVANANVVGRNWILAVINIFGDFNGNIAFGRPDMWVGGQIDVPSSIGNGSELEYKLTVINNGDSQASNVKLQTKTNGDYLAVASASHDYTETPQGLEWSLGTIPAGGAVEIHYKALVQHTTPGTDIINTAEIRLRETDNNNSDNREVLAITTDEKKGNGIRLELGKSSAVQEKEKTPIAQVDLGVERTTSHVTLSGAEKTVEQKLVITNDTNILARNVVLHDILKDEAGVIIRDEVWELGDVFPHEEIELGYTITFNENAVYGTYLLSTTIQGLNASLDSGTNGTIVYAEVVLPQTPLLASLSTQSLFAAASEDTQKAAGEVYHGSETPLIPPLQTPIAEAASGKQLASAAQAGVPLDPIMIFFASVTTLLAFSLLRLYRVF